MPSGRRHAIEEVTAGVPIADDLDQAHRELGVWILLSWHGVRDTASFADHVAHVVPASSGEEMRRIAAGSHVAVMTDVKPLWDCPVRKFVRKPMRQDVLPVYQKMAVSAASRALPNPAFARLVDLRVEALFVSQRHAGAGADGGDVRAVAGLHHAASFSE
jgi:hypothetical protein